MKRCILILLSLLALSACAGSAARRADELEAKNTALTQRVKTLEDQLLAVEKRMIAHEQALQTIRSQQREMENYFNKLQVSRGR